MKPMGNATMRRAFLGLVGFALLIAAASPLPAQGDPGAMAGQYAANAKANAALMRQYPWQMRIELTLKGDVKPAQLYQMRFDADGKPQKTLLSAPTDEGRGRGIRGRIKKHKIKDFKEWADSLGDLVKDYLAPTPGTMMDFYSKAAYAQAADGTIQITGVSFIQPGDKVTYLLDPATKAPRRFSFSTVLDEDAVSGTVDFGQVAGGPQYAARLVVNVPSREVSAKIENFNYQRQ